MAHVVEVLGATNYGNYCIVEVLLDNQEAADVFVGGQVEAYFDSKHGKFKAFIKKKKSDNGGVNEESKQLAADDETHKMEVRI